MDFSLLSKYNIRFPPCQLARSGEEAQKAARAIGFPLAMKIVSPSVLHKSDSGGVVLGVKTPEEAKKAYSLLSGRFSRSNPEGVLVQKMAEKGGVELIVGGKRDAQFGQMVMVGLGGIFVEVFRDVSFRVCPIGRGDALEMVRELRAYPILAGARGRKPVDESAIASVLVAVSKLLERENPKEFDINPLLASEKGCMALDVRIIR